MCGEPNGKLFDETSTQMFISSFYPLPGPWDLCLYGHLPTTPLKLTAKAPENAWLEDCFSYRDGLFSGAVLVAGRVIYHENQPFMDVNIRIFSMDPVGILVFGAEYLKHFFLIAPRFIGRRGCTNSTTRNFPFQSLLVLFKIKKVIGSIQARNQSNISMTFRNRS